MPDTHELVGVIEGQRLEQHTLDDAEDRRVGADAERERKHRDEGEQRRTREPAQNTTEAHRYEFHRTCS